MYRYVPSKRRTTLRVRLGVAFYRALRWALWLRWYGRFARRDKKDACAAGIRSRFPYVAKSHCSPLERNLSIAESALQEGKRANIAIACRRLSGAVVEPGKVFSYWRLVGRPSRRKGYQNGMMLVNGKPVAAIGGGLCALSNLLYWMSLHTPLSVLERFRHSYDVFPDSNRTLPFGSGATCVYNYRDLMLRNDTAGIYALLVWIEDGMLHGEWRSDAPIKDDYEVYQKEHWITAEVGNAYVRHNTIWRRHFVRDENGRRLLSDDYVTENHALMMYEPLLAERPREGASI